MASAQLQGSHHSVHPHSWSVFAQWAASWQNQQNDMCAQRRLRSAWASAQSDQSSLCAQWVAKDPSFLHADSEDSESSLGAHATLLVLSCCSSNSLCMVDKVPKLLHADINDDQIADLELHRMPKFCFVEAQIWILAASSDNKRKASRNFSFVQRENSCQKYSSNFISKGCLLLE